MFRDLLDVTRGRWVRVGATDPGDPGDITAPVISNVVESSLTSSSVTISWDLDEPASGFIEYGTSLFYDSVTTKEVDPLSAHSQVITGLTAGTLYFYRIVSADIAGNVAHSTGDFETTGSIPTPPSTATQFVGLPIAADNKSNRRIREGAAAFRFLASTSSTVTKVRFQARNEIVSSSTRYGDGDKGTYRVGLQLDNGTGIPDGSWFGGTSATTIWAPGARSSNFAVALTFSAGPTTVAGVRYYLVIDNISSDPNNNNSSLNMPNHLDGGPQRKYPNDESVYLDGNLSYVSPYDWRINRGHVPCFDLVYSDGTIDGQAGIIGRRIEGQIGVSEGSQMMRSRFTLNDTVDIDDVSIRISRYSGTGSGDLTFTVRRMVDGVEMSHAIISTSSLGFRSPSSAEGDNGDWADGTLLAQVTLAAGVEYAFEIATPSGTRVWCSPLLLHDSSVGEQFESYPLPTIYWFEESSDSGSSWASAWAPWASVNVAQMYAAVTP